MSRNNLSRRTLLTSLVGGVAACALVLAVTACGTAPVASDAPAAGDAQEQQATMTVTVEIDATAGEGELTSAEVEVPEGASAYDALLATGADVNASDSEYGMYVQGINGLAGGDFGDMSGWMLEVNGEMAEVAGSELELSAGDVATWLYVTEFTE